MAGGGVDAQLGDVIGRPPAASRYHRAPMADRPRYYLTTAIAYANNKPGLHTLYEVIGADVDRALASDDG